MKRDHLIKWAGGLRFIGTGANGHSVVIDGDKETAMSPMELMLLSAGGCACIDLVTILKKARQKVIDVRVEAGGVRNSDFPRYYTDVELHFVVMGLDVKAQHVERAIRLAMEKYCSASAQLAALANIKTSYEIIESALP